MDEFDDLKEALKSIHDILVFSSRDMSKDSRDAWIYGIVCGWNRESYDELSLNLGWTIEDIERNIRLYNAYFKAVNE